MSDIVSEGTHQAIVNAHALVATKSGVEIYQVEFRLNDGSLVSARHKFGTDKSTDLALSQLRALGWTGNDLSNVTLDMKSKFTINVRHEVGNDGKTYVDALVSTGGIKRFELPADKAKSFAQSMTARIAAFDKNGKSASEDAPRIASAPRPVRAPQQQRTNAAAPPDDDFGPMDY